MEMPKPTEAHKKLERIAGRWKGEEKLYPSPWDPKGGTATGTVINRLDLDGFAVLQDYKQEKSGAVSFKGHAVICWDFVQKSYVMYWFDSMGTPPNEFRGSFEDNVMSLTNKSPQGLSRALMDFSRDGKYSFKMDVSQDGKQWQTFMEGNYTKEP